MAISRHLIKNTRPVEIFLHWISVSTRQVRRLRLSIAGQVRELATHICSLESSHKSILGRARYSMAGVHHSKHTLTTLE
jgi:hypothetical protein